MSSPELIFSWLDVLDALTYYELFGIASDVSIDEVREAFHDFCNTFHPDRHIGRSTEERRAVSTIFKRGTEAYLVLTDVALRGHYDTQLTVRPTGYPQRIGFSSLSRPPPSRTGSVTPLDDAVRSSSARPFARRADELIRAGDLQQAKLQLVMANHRDPGNTVLEAALRSLEARLTEPSNRSGRP